MRCKLLRDVPTTLSEHLRGQGHRPTGLHGRGQQSEGRRLGGRVNRARDTAT